MAASVLDGDNTTESIVTQEEKNCEKASVYVSIGPSVKRGIFIAFCEKFIEMTKSEHFEEHHCEEENVIQNIR